MMERIPELTTSIAELLEHWPTCASVFNGRGMACVGCDLSSFETIEEAARVYGLDTKQLLAALRGVVAQELTNNPAT